MEYIAIPKQIEKDAAGIMSGIGKVWNFGEHWAAGQGNLRAARQMLLQKGRPIQQMVEKSKAGLEAAKGQYSTILGKQQASKSRLQGLKGNLNILERQQFIPALQSVGSKFRSGQIEAATGRLKQFKPRVASAEQELSTVRKTHQQTMGQARSQRKALTQEYAAAPKVSRGQLQQGKDIRNMAGRAAILGTGAAVAIPSYGAFNRYQQDQQYQQYGS